MSLRIKKGDSVKLLTGANRGYVGKVIDVNPDEDLVKVENLHMVSRHRKARSAQEQSGIVKMEGNINISNVMLVCPSCGATTRIAVADVDGKKHRVCKKCGFDIDSKKQEKKPEKKRATRSTASEKTETEKTQSRVKRTRKSQKESSAKTE